MRDTTKVALLRQEHSAHVSAKSRDRQAFEFRRQVEERKTELEKLERRIFATGKHIIFYLLANMVLLYFKFIFFFDIGLTFSDITFYHQPFSNAITHTLFEMFFPNFFKTNFIL